MAREWTRKYAMWFSSLISNYPFVKYTHPSRQLLLIAFKNKTSTTRVIGVILKHNHLEEMFTKLNCNLHRHTHSLKLIDFIRVLDCCEDTFYTQQLYSFFVGKIHHFFRDSVDFVKQRYTSFISSFHITDSILLPRWIEINISRRQHSYFNF